MSGPRKDSVRKPRFGKTNAACMLFLICAPKLPSLRCECATQNKHRNEESATGGSGERRREEQDAGDMKGKWDNGRRL